MPVYKIQITKPNQKKPHYRVIKADSIQAAEFFAVDKMLLSPNQISIDDHFKFSVAPIVNLISRTEYKSLFEFKSQFLSKDSGLNRIKILQDDKAVPSGYYQDGFEESIFDYFDAGNTDDNLNSLPFFTANNLDYFSSVIGKEFKAGDREALEIRSKLVDAGVFAQTEKWANELRKRRFKTEFRFDWQHSGRVRGYTWARVFLRGSINEYVFFTVGVGSRFGDSELALVYKLDCRRDRLSRDSVKIFDDYVSVMCPEAVKQVISKDQLDKLTWKELVDRTEMFINKHGDHYRELQKLIPTERKNLQKLARLCWNENGWESPSGSVGKSKTTAKSFEKEKGYGYEEWFFDTEKQIDGYHYAFLQSFNKGDHQGEIYDVHLYAIRDNGRVKDKYWIGYIRNLEVLAEQEAIDIVKIYKSKGWYSQMLLQLHEHNIPDFDFGPVSETGIFNVRYKVTNDSYIRFNPYRRVDNFEREIGGKHYTLMDQRIVSSINPLSGKFEFKEGHNEDWRTGAVVGTYKKINFIKTLKHKEIQNAIYHQLKSENKDSQIKFGTEQTTGNGTLIDLVMYDPREGCTFYEIKTGFSALGCIREGLGQMIEYCYYPNQVNACKLVIIAPHKIDFTIIQYMEHLRNVLNMKLYYQYYSLETNRLEPRLA